MLAAQPVAPACWRAARRRSWAAATSCALLESLYGRVVREGRPAPRHRRRPGRRGQVAAAAGARRAASETGGRRRPRAPGPLPALRVEHRLLGARRGAAQPSAGSSTATPPRWPGASCSQRVERALRLAQRRTAGRAGGAASGACSASRRPARAPLPEHAGSPQRMRESFFSAVRTGDRGDGRGATRSCSSSRTSTGPTTACSTSSSTSAQWVRGPLMILCLARDELLERRPSWGGGRRGATSIFLEPLSDERDARADRLAAARLRRAGADLVPVVAERAGGNPLFVEEMVRLLVEEGGNDGGELPDTVQALLAARLDSLEPFERRLVQHAAVVGRTFWERRRSRRSPRRSGATSRRRSAPCSEKDIVVPGRGHGSSAGEPELAFKHVLIRDVAYGMLPKAVRARKHFEVGELHRGARRRPRRRGRGAARRALRPRRRAGPRGARRLRRARALFEPRRSHFLEAAGDAAARLLLQPRGVRPLPVGARARSPPRRPSRSRGSARSRATSRCGSAAWTRRSSVWEECLEYHRRTRTSSAWPTCIARSAPGYWHKGERKRGDRAPPEGHQPAQGRAALHRARAPVRGGGLALHADRRQHARDLRLREGAAPGRAAGRDARAPAARTASSAACSGASATRPRRARTSSARWSWRAAPTRARRSWRCSRWASTSRSPRPTTPGPSYAYARGAGARRGDRRRAAAGRAARRRSR